MYETGPPPVSVRERTRRMVYAPFGRLSLRALQVATRAAGGATSKSATPTQVLRKVIDAGSSELPVSRVLVNVPFPRRFASGPLPPMICQVPLPPCSAGSGVTFAVKSPPAGQLNRRTAVSVLPS